MPRQFGLMLLAILQFGINAGAQAYEEAAVPFYSETIRITYNPDMLSLPQPKIREQDLVDHFHALAKSDYAPLLRSLQQARKIFQLNDWLYYQLMRNTLDKLYGPGALPVKELACWFFLSQSGFDTRLAFKEQEVFLFLYTQDEVFEAPIIEDRGRQFVNLTDIHSGAGQQRALYLLDFQPNPKGHAFSFRLEKLPLLQPEIVEKQFRFPYKDKWFQLRLSADAVVRSYMNDYPVIDESAYLDIPFSASLSESLLPQLRKMLEGKNEWEATELLAAFTRSAFAYREDKECFGYSKPMAAEEVFLYPYSDCEDRCALFVQLIKELLHLPVIAIAYPGHLTVGVALPQTRPGFIRYQGKAYYICDPTGPVNSAVIGIAPEGFENSPFEIIKSVTN